MKCPKCNKEISELDEKCSRCGINLEEYECQEETEIEQESKTALIKFINIIQILGCIIGAIILWSNEELGIGFIILVIGVIAFAFIKGFQDIIDLLDNINNKITK